MTNIAICEQNPGYMGRMKDGTRVAVRTRDKDGNRKMDFYEVPAECYIDLNNFAERYTWDGQKKVKCNPAKAVFNPLEFLTQEWRMERSGIIGVEPKKGKTFE